MTLPDPRAFTAVASIIGFLLVLALALLTRHRRSLLRWPEAVRMTMTALTLFAGLRVYSATSFLWAGLIPVGVLDLLRYVVLALTVTAGLMLAAVVGYFIRYVREE